MVDTKEANRIRARAYYEAHKEVIRAKNLARYYERLNRQPRIKKPNLEERLGELYLREQELEAELCVGENTPSYTHSNTPADF